MKKIFPIALSILSGLFLATAWPPSSYTWFVFFAWLPLLWIAEKTTKKSSFYWYSFIAIFTWNALTTWWLWNSTDVGSILAIAANSLIMSLPWLGYFLFKQKMDNRIGTIALIAFCMLFEYIHLNWQLSWPWLSLGNVFAGKTEWIQWYEYTGIGGGTLWILLVNILLFQLIKSFKQFTVLIKIFGVVIVVIVIGVPMIISSLLAINFTKGVKENNVVIVQPNIDPYQKFESISVAAQLEILIGLSEKEIDSTTQIVVWPETALSATVPINEIEKTPIYEPVFTFLQKHPNLTLVTGVETYKVVGNEKNTEYARKSPQGFYYESYNAAIALKANTPSQFYIKSKLVPGVETLPSFLNILAPVFEQFGGTTGGYAKDVTSRNFVVNNFQVAPVICYESIYGEYVASYVKKGANLITIITNDGWWGNTPGHKQHLAYAKLRAIETRRWVARSANTGISAVINEYGKIVNSKPWNAPAVIKYNIPQKSMLTFYVKHGDYLYQIFSLIGVLFLLWNWVLMFQKKFFKKKLIA